MSDAIIGYGTMFQTETMDSPNDWLTAAEVIEFSLPEPARDAIDLSHEHGPNEWVASMPGMKKAGPVSFKFNFIPGSTGTYADLYAEYGDQTVRARRLVFPNGAILPFDAYLTTLKADAPIGGAMTATATFQVSGEPGPIV